MEHLTGHLLLPCTAGGGTGGENTVIMYSDLFVYWVGLKLVRPWDPSSARGLPLVSYLFNMTRLGNRENHSTIEV